MKIQYSFFLLLLFISKTFSQDVTSAASSPMKRCNPESISSCFQNREKANHGFIISKSDSNKKIVKTKYVALLIHGLSDSPYFYRDIAQTIFNQGINVVAIRTTGHGTHKSHLKDVKREQWYADTKFGVSLAKKYGNNIIIGGMSNGGSLALRETQRNNEIKGLMLFSGAIKTPKKMIASCALVNPIIKYPFKFVGGLVADTNDYQATKSYGVDIRYQGIHNNGTCELVKMNIENDLFAKHSIFKRNRHESKEKLYSNLTIPVLNVVSEYDGVLDLDYTLNLSNNIGSNKLGKSYLVLYKNPTKTYVWSLPEKSFVKNVNCMNHASVLLRPSPEMGYSDIDYFDKCSYTDEEIKRFNQETTYDYTPEVNFHFDLLEEGLLSYLSENFQ